MEEKINIAEILKDKPNGIRLYSPIFGECAFSFVREEANPALVDSIKTSDALSGSEYRLYTSSLTMVYKDTNDIEINGWYTDSGKPILTEFNDKGFKPAFKYYRWVYKIENGIKIQDKKIYFNTSESIIL